MIFRFAKKRRLSVIRTEIQAARLEGDFQTLERLLIKGSHHDHRRQEFLLPLARLYDELSMPRAALDIWRLSFECEVTLEAAYHVLRNASQADRPTIKLAIEDTFSSEAFHAVEALLEQGPTMAKKGARHLAICGVSYSGSTLLGRLLDSLDDVHDIGESHWLINQRQAVNGRREIDFFDSSPSPSRPYCRQCGENCTVLSTTFRIEMQLYRSQWYSRLAGRLGADILVSSDKNAAKYLTLDPLLRFDAIILFKSPAQAWRSFRKRQLTDDPAEMQAKLDYFIRTWNREYKNALEMKSKGKKLFLHFDWLSKAPEQTLVRLLEILDLPKRKPDLARTANAGHAIGGNDGFVDALRRANKIEIRGEEDVALPDHELRMLDDDAALSATFDELLSLSDAQFGQAMISPHSQ